MARLVIVSNRVVDLAKAAQAGGVAVVLADIVAETGGLWFGWNGRIDETADQTSVPQVKIARTRASGATATVSLTPEEHRDFYLGYSNSVLWPVFHNRLDLAQFDAGYYDRYKDVNRRFAAALFPLLHADDIIWIHDYQLIPLAKELRQLGADNAIGFFLHIPVPPSQTFLAIPEHRELAEALSVYDLIGLQTTADVANLIQFLEDSVSGRILQDGRIRAFDRALAIERFPIGINAKDFAAVAPPEEGDRIRGAHRIIGVDRLDYSKGLPQKFAAFGRFLEKHPEYRRKVVLSQIAPPTRESVEAYSDIRTTLESLSGKINGMYGELDWVPIHYIHRSASRKRLRDIYRSSRIGMFTPLRDGMNLVAKEYVASQDPEDPGVLILSRFAGAAEQLGDALIVNPYNVDEMSGAIFTALEMGKSERVERHRALLSAVNSSNSEAWARSYLDALKACGKDRHQTSPSGATVRKALEKLKGTVIAGEGGLSSRAARLPR